ncbi:MAG: T9SS type A sorting domain-containing protein, partial [Bacteroidales bacterium]|nr:T9SS type A sorting domain-containing protein [Bacteroidales bacterium]
EGVFDPVAAGLGVHVVNYKFVDENGCSAACQFQITVNPSTTLVCPESFAMCISDDPILMSQAIPPGGSYSGTGVDGGYFDPELAGVGVHAISYDFTNGFGCHTACSFTIEVYPLPELSCSFPEEVCLYDGPIVLDGCEPDGGIYSGTGVTCNTFFPEIAGAGLHEIHYHYIHPATGCTNDASFTIRVLPAQIVSLPYGWTGISSYMITKNTEITEIFAGISDHLIILYNLTGTIWYPGGNIYPQSPWDMYSGYILKSGQGVNMNFCGDYLQNLTVQLLPGWNLVPMLSKNPVSSEFLFGFNEHIKIVKEVAGWKLLWKEMGINTLGFVVPGEAYYVYSTGATSVTFPYYAKEEPMEIKPDAIYSSPFEPVEMTPVSHLVALPCLMANLFEEGDIIAAFGESGICAGQIRMDKENTALTLFGDDQYTWEQDGMQADENVYYRMFRSSDGSYFDLEFEFDQNWQNGNHFQPEGISVVKGVTLSPSGLPDVSQHAVKLYPNPTTGVVLVTGIEGDFQIEVFNVVQEQILTLNLSGESQFDLSALPKGVYMVKIIGDGMIFTRKIVLQ